MGLRVQLGERSHLPVDERTRLGGASNRDTPAGERIFQPRGPRLGGAAAERDGGQKGGSARAGAGQPTPGVPKRSKSMNHVSRLSNAGPWASRTGLAAGGREGSRGD